ncbi:nucleotidyltransferase family protein [Pelomonas sp. P7]|uniref:Nucleotidyltransferase family protein n=1 Tax=Pelomonas caseinilytica TaxID=2906763 RepID=A0ABS8XH63_9BURK|nr:nucleotidyltransferase family protein [Pelomonas sp. P7]MCE4540212.1 nucleotidyltransferase family protein [Pelomonas sp. P7]
MRADVAQLAALVRATPWFMAALRAGRDLGLAQWCIGAGALRNLVWDALHGYAQPTAPADVDLAYFCAEDLDPARDAALQRRLQQRCPSLPWEVTNQAGVHLWFEAHFGHAVAPLKSLDEAVATWPEPATAVAVWLDGDDALHVIAPHGLADLLGMRIRRNPVRVCVETYQQRCESKRYVERWPRVVVEME